jgi:asparagine synthase (glutamine-hydrolysing)
MCGIAGGVWTDPRRAIDANLIRSMTDVIRHRGPDDNGHWLSRVPAYLHQPEVGVALGFRRLSIIDVEGGHQPLCNEDESVWLVFNGEIYNYRELRQRLEGAGHQFRTDSDTETIVHLWEDLGPECVQHLNGMFAIAIWDTKKRTLFLARDRLGKKPLYYYHRPGQLVFGSELKVLTEVPDFPKRVDPRAIDMFLTYQYIPHPYTIYEGVRKLPPGHFALYSQDKLEVKKYWNLDLNHEVEIAEAEASERLQELLTDSIKLRLRSDVPLGAFLSGGIDSSLIVRLAQDQLTQPLHTFSIGFSEADYDETAYARMVAQAVGTVHEEFRVTPDAVSVLDQLAWHYDEPFGDSSAIPTWYLSELTRKHVTVALSGDGGDELFGGYDRYRALLLSTRINYLPGTSLLGQDWFQHLRPSAKRRSFLRRLQRFGKALNQPLDRRYMNWIQIFPEELRGDLYEDAFMEKLPNEDPFVFFGSAWKQTSQRDLVNRASLSDLITYLPCDLMCKVDIASMAHSLEARQPFLDYRLVEFAASLPGRLKLRGSKGKRILRDTFNKRLPPQIWNRPKMGFGVPLGKWFREDLRSRVEETLLADDAYCRSMFRPDAVRTLVSQHVRGEVNHQYRLWQLLMLETWMRRWNPTLP